ncbi:DUF2846 domain-containing protein [Flavobacterium sp. RSP15]|uniref:DUF2846 domain-containing protein n=1 Tax=Flavobacterium sp. RSP15 TaxID=2497485 RepID=UPI000F829D15|nr:DUF2846 domain-containing protein [Flavobacterium sp. RSP15]
MLNSYRNLIVILLILLSFTSLMKAQDIKKVNNEKIYFLRSTGWGGSFSRLKFFIDDKFVCKAKYKKYSIHEVPIGRHEISLKYGNMNLKTNKGASENFVIQVESGKATYFELVYETGVFSVLIYLMEIDEKTAKEKMKEMEENKGCL